MKKAKKCRIILIPVIMLAFVILFSNISSMQVHGVSTGPIDWDDVTDGKELTGIEGVENLATNIWATFTVVAQVLAFIAIIIAGIRYMFASADQKADIKKQTVILVVGAIFVFGASLIVQIITGVLNDTTSDIVEQYEEREQEIFEDY